MEIPKYINNKIDRMNSLIEQAISLRHEIEKWAEIHGADIGSEEWYENVRDEMTVANGMYIDGIKEYFDNEI